MCCSCVVMKRRLESSHICVKSMLIFLSLSLIFSGATCGMGLGECPADAGAQEEDSTCADIATLSAAEESCTTANNCTGLTDPSFGSDCVGNREEHCAEIAACTACEAEIRAMFDCEQ